MFEVEVKSEVKDKVTSEQHREFDVLEGEVYNSTFQRVLR